MMMKYTMITNRKFTLSSRFRLAEDHSDPLMARRKEYILIENLDND